MVKMVRVRHLIRHPKLGEVRHQPNLLMVEMGMAVDEILRRSKFAGNAQKMEVLRVYEKGIEELERRIMTAAGGSGGKN